MEIPSKRLQSCRIGKITAFFDDHAPIAFYSPYQRKKSPAHADEKGRKNEHEKSYSKNITVNIPITPGIPKATDTQTVA